VSDVSETDFAVAIQELGAEATASTVRTSERMIGGITALLSAVHSLGQRLEAIEESITRNAEALQFQKIENHLSVIRETESVNQKLFDTLHQELASYRDNFVRESLQKPVIRDLLVLFDDLSSIAEQFAQLTAGAETRPSDSRASDNIQNVLHFLMEILQRLEVTPIEQKRKIDRTLHRVIDVEPTDSAEEDGLIVKRLRQGFLWRESVVRPEEVISKRFR
jgi:molecular chaperone GrpE (heat shock protein)